MGVILGWLGYAKHDAAGLGCRCGRWAALGGPFVEPCNEREGVESPGCVRGGLADWHFGKGRAGPSNAPLACSARMSCSRVPYIVIVTGCRWYCEYSVAANAGGWCAVQSCRGVSWLVGPHG